MIHWLDGDAPFPPLSETLGPDSGAAGLLAASARVTPRRVLDAYRHGIFPWYSEGQPVLWWSPDPRMALFTRDFRVSHSLRKTLKAVLRDPAWEIRVDHDFPAVMRACAEAPREGQDGTWITEPMLDAYAVLHRSGYAHSVETWHRGVRTGGLYGVALGRMFFGESMFARRPDASKIALAALVGYFRYSQVEMIDCQQNTSHLASLGAREIARDAFLAHLRTAIHAAPPSWQFDKTVLLNVMQNVMPEVVPSEVPCEGSSHVSSEAPSGGSNEGSSDEPSEEQAAIRTERPTRGDERA